MSVAMSDPPSRATIELRSKIIGAVVFVMLAAAILIALLSVDSASAQGSGEGATIYADSCASCHQADGSGIPGSFPPLKGNPNVADTAHVESVVQNGLSGPIDVNGETYDSDMPAVTGLSPAEVTAVSEYVASLAGGGGETEETTAPEPAEPGGSADGQKMFSGAISFENGGAACVGCHTAGEVGNFGGAGLGPDLTNAVETLGGEAGLAAWLKAPPAPTMIPIFEDHPLTDPEIADVVAFLAEAPDQEKADPAVDWMLVAGVIGAAILLGGMALAWRGMRQTYRERMRSRT